MEKMGEAKSWFFKKTTKTGSLLARWMKKNKREKIHKLQKSSMKRWYHSQ